MRKFKHVQIIVKSNSKLLNTCSKNPQNDAKDYAKTCVQHYATNMLKLKGAHFSKIAPEIFKNVQKQSIETSQNNSKTVPCSGSLILLQQSAFAPPFCSCFARC